MSPALEDVNKKEFSFGWLAMKLLGKGLYSNAWSALSELIANGFDAGASSVHVFIDLSNKPRSRIEIFDDGSGMSEDQLEIYTKVGFNKRNEPFPAGMEASDIMGRKGIGKLGALFLSNDYYIVTKIDGITTSWQMTYIENPENEDEKPYINEVDECPPIQCSEEWNKINSGTLLILKNVDLSGYGDKAIDSLNTKVANAFSIGEKDSRKILLSIKSYPEQPIAFEEVQKKIAFGNFAFLTTFEGNPRNLQTELKKYEDHEVKIPFPDKTQGNFNHSLKIEQISIRDSYSWIDENKKQQSLPYLLYGWIGIHSTLVQKIAQENDSRYLKNTYHNPIQLRLYVRNKLAIENLLPMIQNNQTYANYIEGEVHFDLLDNDKLPDIATSNRQSMDESDERMEILKNLLRPLLNKLIKQRVELANSIKEEQKKRKDKIKDNAKQAFAQEVEKDISNIPNMEESLRSNLAATIINKVKGDVVAKDEYLIFLSHASDDVFFSDFFYYLLLKKGVNSNEIFYTSRDGKTEEDYKRLTILQKQIKENIVKTNTLIVFLTGKNFLKSQYCMFEGGAGWATRATLGYEIGALEYEDIPAYLMEGEEIRTLFYKSNDIILDPTRYNAGVSLLNTMIDHINTGRNISGKSNINKFDLIEFPDKAELIRSGKEITDYMDPLILEYWEAYISSEKDNYIAKHYL